MSSPIYGIDYGMKPAIKKVTVHLPKKLLDQALKATGEGTTDTVRQGLQLLSTRQAYAALRQRRGTLRLDLDVAALRDDE